MRTRTLLTHAIQNVSHLDPCYHEDAMAKSATIAKLKEFRTLYADLIDAIDHDDTSAAYNAVDILIDTVRIANGRSRDHAAAAD